MANFRISLMSLVVFNALVGSLNLAPAAAESLSPGEKESVEQKVTKTGNKSLQEPLLGDLDLSQNTVDPNLILDESAQLPVFEEPLPPPQSFPSLPSTEFPTPVSPPFWIDSPIPPPTPTVPQFQLEYNNQFSRHRLGVGDAIAPQTAGFPEFGNQSQNNNQGKTAVPI
ncbi:MAG: hypothetical protein SAJ11_02380, partial [Jaaginema sp. PMC 1078.18]|nr:hypothetical protein [Jaaginema sp. PMC 1078.18]